MRFALQHWIICLIRKTGILDTYVKNRLLAQMPPPYVRYTLKVESGEFAALHPKSSNICLHVDRPLARWGSPAINSSLFNGDAFPCCRNKPPIVRNPSKMSYWNIREHQSPISTWLVFQNVRATNCCIDMLTWTSIESCISWSFCGRLPSNSGYLLLPAACVWAPAPLSARPMGRMDPYHFPMHFPDSHQLWKCFKCRSPAIHHLILS